eukprot:127857_1
MRVTSTTVIFAISLLFGLNIIILQYITQLRFSHSTSSNPNHLIVIQHGLNYPSIVNYPTYYYLKHHLSNNNNNNNEDEYMIYVAHSNSAPHLFSFFYHTNAGIVHASTNLANEIYDIIIENPTIDKISFIGSSIGGNYIRYTSYLLHVNKSYNINNISFFNRIQPKLLIALAAPHFGISDWISNLVSQQFMDLLYKYSPSLTVLELLNIDDNRIVNTMNKNNCVFQLFDKVFIFYNSGWDSLVSCQSSSIDFDGTHCPITKDYCDKNINTVFDQGIINTLQSNGKNQTFQRVPICLKRNLLEKLMAHAILSISLPPISKNVANLITST